MDINPQRNAKTKNYSVARIDINFSLVESFYEATYCCISSFTVIYLSYRGLTNTLIGLTSAITCIISLVLQLLLSDFMDKHLETPIKRIISIILIAGIFCAGLLQFLPMPVAMMMIVYSGIAAVMAADYTYVSTQLMQFNNVGIPAHFGPARGFGSLAWGIMAYILGIMVEKYDASILLNVYIVMAVLTIIFVLLMPDPYKGLDRERLEKIRKNKEYVSYKEMIRKNKKLLLLLCCIICNNIGNVCAYTFSVRVIEALGGGTAEYGLCEMIRACAEVPVLLASAFFLKHFTSRSLVQISFFFYTVRSVLVAIAPTIGLIYLANALNMFCVGFYAFASVIYVNSITGPREKARGQSLIGLCASIGSIIGSALAGRMIDSIGVRPTIFGGGIFCLAAFLMMTILGKSQKEA